MHNGGLERLSYLTIITELYTTPWIFIGSTDTEAEAPILWPLNANSQHFGKDPDAGKDWKQKEKRASEVEMVGWHHWCKGHELGQTPGDGGGQGGLVCCSPWDHKQWETSWRLNNIYHLYWSQRLCSSTLYMLIPLKFLNGNLMVWTLYETL